MSGSESPQRVRVVFRDAPGVLVDGQETDLRSTSDGALVVSAGAPSVPTSFDTGGTAAQSGVIKASPGVLLDVNGHNDLGAVRYFLLFDAIAVPGAGAVADVTPIRITSRANFSISFADSLGRTFTVGIAWATSTSASSLIIPGVASLMVNAQYN